VGQNRDHRDSRPETILFNGSVWRDSHGVSVDWHRYQRCHHRGFVLDRWRNNTFVRIDRNNIGGRGKL